MKTERPCIVCGRPFLASSKNSKICSAACRGQYLQEATERKYAERIGEPIGEWLRRRYVDELATYRDLMADLGLTNVRILMRMMVRHRIPVRDPSQAVATQYIRNPQRREIARTVFLANDLPPKKGEPNHAQQPEVGQKISAAKTGHSMYQRQDWKERVCAYHQRREQERPETDIERLMREALEAKGIPFHQQYPVQTYVIDFAILVNGHQVGVECDGHYWHHLPRRAKRDPERDAELAGSGWLILRFPEADIRRDLGRCIKVIQSAIET